MQPAGHDLLYDRKGGEGKRHIQAVLALACGRVNVLWALLRDDRLYQPMPLDGAPWVPTPSLCRMQSLIDAIRQHPEAAAFLAGVGDFDLDSRGHVEAVHLASGVALEGFARDAAGGAYFFCGEGGEERPVL